MATLNALPHQDKVEFTRLRAILAATDGNLGAHLTTLEDAGYVIVEKEFVARKPRTRVAITVKGRAAFMRHVAYLRGLLANPPTDQAAE
jgi:DNA-binding MarR family transcriptional regulator